MSGSAPPQNACTIDVEDYFQVSAFESVVGRARWEDYPSRVEANTDAILEILGARGVRGTFFILGWIAKRFPALVTRIADAGHEIGCHSLEHRLVYSMEPAQFRSDTRAAKDAIEQIIGTPVRLYRAPSFSITAQSTWAIEILIEEGFDFDSSIFPVRHDRYGIPHAPVHPYRIRTASGELIEFPPSVYRFLGVNFPFGGGGYLRLYPLAVSMRWLKRLNRHGRGVNLYVHPWEFDPGQPRVNEAAAISRFRHYVRIASARAKFERLLASAPFGTLSEAAGDRRKLASYALENGRLRRLPVGTPEPASSATAAPDA